MFYEYGPRTLNHLSDLLISGSADPSKPIFITIGILATVAMVIISLVVLRRRQGYKYLERRSLISADDVDENGDHYFVMRPPTEWLGNLDVQSFYKNCHVNQVLDKFSTTFWGICYVLAFTVMR